MKLFGGPRLELTYLADNLIIPFQHGQTHALNELIGSLGQLDLTKEYTVKIERQRLKRSLDANAYMWTLIGKLAEKMYLSNTEVYREYIKDYGIFQIVPMREDAIARWTKDWEDKGLGRVCMDMGPCRNFAGYHNIKCYYGSSDYDTKEMSRLIDAVVADCKENGIETMTPDQLLELKQKWGDR